MKYLIIFLTGCAMMKGGGAAQPAPQPSAGGEPAPTETTGAPPVAGPDANGDITVPSLIGKTADEAAALVKAAGFRNDMEQSAPVDCGPDAPREPGKINCQSPPAGSKQKAYAMVQVKVFTAQTHPGRLIAEDLVPLKGMTVEEGTAYLAKLGYHGEIKTTEPMQFIAGCAAGKICAYEPNALNLLSPTEHIFFTLNKASAKITTPDP